MSKEPKNTILNKTDHVRRRLLKGAGVASAASALSVPLILVPPRAYAATELNMIAWYGHG